jgi:hypothetical protein
MFTKWGGEIVIFISQSHPSLFWHPNLFFLKGIINLVKYLVYLSPFFNHKTPYLSPFNLFHQSLFTIVPMYQLSFLLCTIKIQDYLFLLQSLNLPPFFPQTYWFHTYNFFLKNILDYLCILSRFTRSNETISSPSYTSLPPAPIELQKTFLHQQHTPKAKGELPKSKTLLELVLGNWLLEEREKSLNPDAG